MRTRIVAFHSLYIRVCPRFRPYFLFFEPSVLLRAFVFPSVTPRAGYPDQLCLFLLPFLFNMLPFGLRFLSGKALTRDLDYRCFFFFFSLG